MARLLLDAEEHPGDPGPLYFLSRQYILNNQPRECIEWGLRFLAMEGIHPCEAYANIAAAHHALGDTQEALRWLYKAVAEEAHRRIWWVHIAELHMTQGRWHLGLVHLRLASELLPEFEWQQDPTAAGPRIFELIEKCQRALKDIHHVH